MIIVIIGISIGIGVSIRIGVRIRIGIGVRIGIGIGIDCTRRRCAPTKKGFPKEGNPFYRRIPGYILSSSR